MYSLDRFLEYVTHGTFKVKLSAVSCLQFDRTVHTSVAILNIYPVFFVEPLVELACATDTRVPPLAELFPHKKTLSQSFEIPEKWKGGRMCQHI